MAQVKLIRIKEEILADNKGLAERLREGLKSRGVFLLNVMSSPGSGKTSLILRTIDALRAAYRIAVIEADLDSTVDADRVSSAGVPAVQIETGGFCHVDAAMTERALEFLDLDTLDLVIIENVGNLVCPAQSDTGAVANAVILSVPEGDDKPLKYPVIFVDCDIVVVNKIDYLAIAEFDLDAFTRRVHNLNRGVPICRVSCKTGDGLACWCGWLTNKIVSYREE